MKSKTTKTQIIFLFKRAPKAKATYGFWKTKGNVIKAIKYYVEEYLEVSPQEAFLMRHKDLHLIVKRALISSPTNKYGWKHWLSKAYPQLIKNRTYKTKRQIRKSISKNKKLLKVSMTSSNILEVAKAWRKLEDLNLEVKLEVL